MDGGNCERDTHAEGNAFQLTIPDKFNSNHRKAITRSWPLNIAHRE
jgi:hypothetical protein